MQERIYTNESVSGITGIKSPLLPFEALPDERTDVAVVIDKDSLIKFAGSDLDRYSGSGTIFVDNVPYKFDFDCDIGDYRKGDFTMSFEPRATDMINLKRNLMGNSKKYQEIFSDTFGAVEISAFKEITGHWPVEVTLGQDGLYKVTTYQGYSPFEVGTIDSNEVVEDIKAAIVDAINYGEFNTDDSKKTNDLIAGFAEGFAKKYGSEMKLDETQTFALQREFNETFWGDAVETINEMENYQAKMMSNEREIC